MSFPKEPPATESVKYSAATLQAVVGAVAHHTDTLDEGREVLQMLGLLPTPPSGKRRRPIVREAWSTPAPVGNTGRCLDCGRPTVNSRTEKAGPGVMGYGGRGMCKTCYRAVLRKEKSEALK